MARRSLWQRALRAVGLSRGPTATRQYAGAKHSGLTSDWFTSMLSAAQEVKGSLQKLRDRSRALVRDFAYASRFVQSVQENVVGPDGIRLQVRVASQGGSLKSSLNDEVEAKWAEWCEPENASVDGRLGFVDLEHLIMETLPQDGEVLVRIVRGFPGNRFRFALQLLDADQLDTQFERNADANGDGWIRMGVEMNRWGKPVAYWLWTVHPSEYGKGTRRRERVLAEDLIYLGIQRRPGQIRAVPWFAPVIISERMLSGWEEASITAARSGALTPFWFTAPDPDKVNEGSEIPVDYSMELSQDVQGQALPPGYTVQTFDPKYPNAEFDPFRAALLRSIAVGLRVSDLTLTGDLRNANYSSMRAGLLPEREAWKLLARWFVRHFHRRVYREWVKASVLADALEVPPRELERVLNAATWQFRGFPWVDPKADLEAAQTEVGMGIQTLTNLAAERGRDFEDVMKQRQEENALAEEYGVTITLNSAAASPAPSTEDETDPAAKAETEAAKTAADAKSAADRAWAVAERAQQIADGSQRVLEQQAKALAVAAAKPIPPAQVTIAEGAIRHETHTHIAPPAPPAPMRKTITVGGMTGELVETPVTAEEPSV